MPVLMPVCEAARRQPARQTCCCVTSGTHAGAKLRVRLNHFRFRARLHAHHGDCSLRARNLVNAGQGYRDVKKSAERYDFAMG
jgi:hypothetical protein